MKAPDIDPYNPPDPLEHRDRVRAQYGLPPKGMRGKPADEVIDVAIGAGEEAVGGADILDQALDESERQREAAETEEPEFRALRRAAEMHVSFADTELARLQKRQWETAEDYWAAVNTLLDRRLEARQRENTKLAKQANIGEGARAPASGQTLVEPDASEAARELQGILEGKHGSASSPRNRARRAQLKEQLRRG